MTRATSLRARLTVIILGPLLVIACAAGFWAWREAIERAADRFDRSLLSTALAISRDTALSDGDLLQESTRDLLRDTSGGPVFYHVYAPDGVFVTGYATPPVAPTPARPLSTDQTYYDAIYQGRSVRALRFSDVMVVDGLTGPFTFTVWQNTDVRTARVRGLIRSTTIVIATLIAGLAVVVWFGVRLGLRPLSDLEDAISRRSVSDLSPIRRPIPPEVTGIVGTLNDLLAELSDAMRAKDVFVSNAAHQLRNPVAGVLSLAESLQTAPDEASLRRRSDDIVAATRDLSRLANGMLTIERANALTPERFAPVDVVALLASKAPDFEKLCAEASSAASSEASSEGGVALEVQLPDRPLIVKLDALLLEQSVRNLLTNALVHGGADLSQITLGAEARSDNCRIWVQDDGVGLAPQDVPLALARFGQVRPTEGSGLGLAIVEAAATAFGGEIRLLTKGPGLGVEILLPRVRTL